MRKLRDFFKGWIFFVIGKKNRGEKEKIEKIC